MNTKSLSFRLLLAEGLVLSVFFVLVAVVLEQGFRETAENALQERLQIQAYSLLSVTEFNNGGDLIMPSNLHDPRFLNPGSGLYGFIQQGGKKILWRSPSAIGLDVSRPPQLAPGASVFFFDNSGRYVLHYAATRKDPAGMARDYLFTVEEDAQIVSNQIQSLQNTLRIWLIVIAITLVAIQFTLLRWSLKPLRKIVHDLEAVEEGRKSHLDGSYPTELHGLAGNLNAFISIERAHLERYRNNLADLAHSLKTPLAILRGCVESFNENKQTVQEQISRMNEIVEYQLQRAAAKGEHKTIKTADLSAIINKITASLSKVYVDKNIIFHVEIPESCPVFCEEGDLYEIVGNLMDNACKWCKQHVKVTIALNQRKARRNFSVLLEITDDGPGIPVGKFNEILKRGVRADENIHGHGIGMTIVYELIELMNGKLEGGKSTVLGGMRWSIYLP